MRTLRHIIDDTKLDYNKKFCKELMTLTIYMANLKLINSNLNYLPYYYLVKKNEGWRTLFF